MFCQTVSRTRPREPLSATKMPKSPWDTLYLDFYGPLPTSEYLLVAIDRYSGYPERPEVEIDQIFAHLNCVPTGNLVQLVASWELRVYKIEKTSNHGSHYGR